MRDRLVGGRATPGRRRRRRRRLSADGSAPLSHLSAPAAAANCFARAFPPNPLTQSCYAGLTPASMSSACPRYPSGWGVIRVRFTSDSLVSRTATYVRAFGGIRDIPSLFAKERVFFYGYDVPIYSGRPVRSLIRLKIAWTYSKTVTKKKKKN